MGNADGICLFSSGRHCFSSQPLHQSSIRDDFVSQTPYHGYQMEPIGYQMDTILYQMEPSTHQMEPLSYRTEPTSRRMDTLSRKMEPNGYQMDTKGDQMEPKVDGAPIGVCLGNEMSRLCSLIYFHKIGWGRHISITGFARSFAQN